MTSQQLSREEAFSISQKSITAIMGTVFIILISLFILGYLTIRLESVMVSLFRGIRYYALFSAGILLTWTSPF